MVDLAGRNWLERVLQPSPICLAYYDDRIYSVGTPMYLSSDATLHYHPLIIAYPAEGQSACRELRSKLPSRVFDFGFDHKIQCLGYLEPLPNSPPSLSVLEIGKDLQVNTNATYHFPNSL